MGPGIKYIFPSLSLFLSSSFWGSKVVLETRYYYSESLLTESEKKTLWVEAEGSEGMTFEPLEQTVWETAVTNKTPTWDCVILCVTAVLMPVLLQ